MATNPNRRKESSFFTVASVSSTSFNHKISWSFTSVGLCLINYSDSSSDIIEYSFNGYDVAGDLRPNTPSQGIIFDNRHQSTLWLRRKTAGAAVDVRVEAWRADA